MNTHPDISCSHASPTGDTSPFDKNIWQGAAIGLLDLDAFFASVEQLDHPNWRGKPVIVGGSPDKRGVVSTASYEARKFGVHSAMPSLTAQKLCPKAIWTSGNYGRYQEMSKAVMDILSSETPLVEQVSIDEAFFDITPGRYSHESPIHICQRIQRRVAELGVTCSIGIGCNKTVAKIASEREKPRGLTVVVPGTEQRFLAPLPIEAMSGIGPSTARKLHSRGIKTLGQLSRADVLQMESLFGIAGPRLVTRAAGREVSHVREAACPREVKSVSNERTFDTDLTDEHEIRAAIKHICGIVGRRLRKKHLKGHTVTLKIKNSVTSSHTAQRTLDIRTDQEDEFSDVAEELLGEVWHFGQPVRLIGVGISGFSEVYIKPTQPTLFDENTFDDTNASQHPHVRTLPHRPSLSAVTDALKDKYGADAVRFGRDLRFEGRVSDTMPTGKDNT